MKASNNLPKPNAQALGFANKTTPSFCPNMLKTIGGVAFQTLSK